MFGMEEQVADIVWGGLEIVVISIETSGLKLQQYTKFLSNILGKILSISLRLRHLLHKMTIMQYGLHIKHITITKIPNKYNRIFEQIIICGEYYTVDQIHDIDYHIYVRRQRLLYQSILLMASCFTMPIFLLGDSLRYLAKEIYYWRQWVLIRMFTYFTFQLFFYNYINTRRISNRIMPVKSPTSAGFHPRLYLFTR